MTQPLGGTLCWFLKKLHTELACDLEILLLVYTQRTESKSSSEHLYKNFHSGTVHSSTRRTCPSVDDEHTKPAQLHKSSGAGMPPVTARKEVRARAAMWAGLAT